MCLEAAMPSAAASQQRRPDLQDFISNTPSICAFIQCLLEGRAVDSHSLSGLQGRRHIRRSETDLTSSTTCARPMQARSSVCDDVVGD